MPKTQGFPSLFRRCVQCESVTPSCPPCGNGETCLLLSQSCTACASATCVKAGSLPGQPAPTKASATPAIAGGVVGGVLFIILLTVLLWWFCIRKRRQQWDEQVWTETEQTFDGVEKRDQGGLNREARQSTRSIGSIASTAHTRASNVIQIAYIPGVTNRSPTESPGLMVPPVPALPFGSAASSNTTSPNFDEDRFFMPDDLRNSTSSDLSARQSLSPSLARASNATAIYRSHAEVSPRPAQQALRGKAAVVTLSKSGNNSPSDSDLSQESTTKNMLNSPIVARNVTARPIQVKKSNSVKKAKAVPTLANLQAVATNKRIGNLHAQPEERFEDETETDASTHLMTTIRSAHQSAAATIIEDTSPAMTHSQFTNSSASSTSDSASAARRKSAVQRPSPSGSTSSGQGQRLSYRHKKSGSLSSLIEEAVNRAARDPRHGGLGSISEGGQNESRSHPVSQGVGVVGGAGHVRSDSGSGASLQGPFSDENELRELDSRSS